MSDEKQKVAFESGDDGSAKPYPKAPEGLIDPLQLRHYYIGAVALLARLSDKSAISAEDKALIAQCVRDCAGNFPETFEAVDTAGGGVALEPRASRG